MEAEQINIVLAFFLLITSIASLLFRDQWRSIGRKNEALQKKLDEQCEKVQKAETEATKERLKNVELNSKHESLTKKYDFMRTNARKFNVGDFVESMEIVEVDVKMVTILDHIITGGINLFNALFSRKSVVPFKKPEFIYKVKQSESWFTETELENHSNSVPITKRKYKKRTTKKQVKPKK